MEGRRNGRERHPTVDASGNRGRRRVIPWDLGMTLFSHCPASTPDPARPDALSAAGAWSPGRCTRANRSPPIPQVSRGDHPEDGICGDGCVDGVAPGIERSQRGGRQVVGRDHCIALPGNLERRSEAAPSPPRSRSGLGARPVLEPPHRLTKLVLEDPGETDGEEHIAERYDLAVHEQPEWDHVAEERQHRRRIEQHVLGAGDDLGSALVPPATYAASLSTGIPPLATITVKFIRMPTPTSHIPVCFG